ncbi:hypothetical protein Tco_1035355 [Tanacetum coccineum]
MITLMIKKLKKEIMALVDYNEAIKDEERFLFQKAKVEWISKGDRNNLYLHKVVKSRKQANMITCICDEQGNRLEGRQMEDQFASHFQKFFKANKNVKEMKDFEGVFGTRLNEEEALSMVREIIDSEIKMPCLILETPKHLVLMDIHPLFSKKAWEMVRADVCLAIKEFFNTGKLLGELNATLMSLIP